MPRLLAPASLTLPRITAPLFIKCWRDLNRPAALGQVREFKEAFGFFNSQNRKEPDLTAAEILQVVMKFAPESEVNIKVCTCVIFLPVRAVSLAVSSRRSRRPCRLDCPRLTRRHRTLFRRLRR